MSGREVDSSKLETVEEYAKTQEDLTAYVKSLGFKMTGNTMSCPFHGSDSTPSLKINGHKWKCFGCGRGGGYMKFRHECELLTNHKKTYYDVVDDYVREHSDLSAIVGGTIFKTTEESFNEQWEKMQDSITTKAYRPKCVKVQSTGILISKARNMDTDVKIRLLSGIQEDLPFNVLKSIVNGTDLTGKTLFELSEG